VTVALGSAGAAAKAGEGTDCASAAMGKSNMSTDKEEKRLVFIWGLRWKQKLKIRRA
jgi:hypothetical protein